MSINERPTPEANQRCQKNVKVTTNECSILNHILADSIEVMVLYQTGTVQENTPKPNQTLWFSKLMQNRPTVVE